MDEGLLKCPGMSTQDKKEKGPLIPSWKDAVKKVMEERSLSLVKIEGQKK